ncbi:NADP-dependent oxidoreductase [Alphaproteobacteria bacterium]|nr:NADP-dependent oxidoreductase [Alphaproteobacteria bacterium]MDA8625734.1 NADP-dependent oxidoreductase [Alphaproteobacteria bacterium]MDA8666828.1 NADP-dependent oxidoreductase [Alphaproteobacteria bacterium]MDA8779753.1 NADP-dependent oxidoreductase [Alphaproteobacteria bacterium]MDB2406515.1 NADP-dependent oxidoreductase [Alphaproteobacteria bacterium]
MDTKITQIRMSDYPGRRAPREIWQTTHDALPELRDGQVAARIDFVSIDPGMTGWITDKRGYMPPVRPGSVMRAFGVGEIIESRSDNLAVGDWITGFLGMRSHGVFNDKDLRLIDVEMAPPELFLSGLGMTGYTAYFGMMDIGRPKADETIVVSAAAGAVGSMAAQLAKNAGARVIGIAGGAEKCRYLTETLKLDAAIDYKSENIGARLDDLAPNHIDLYYDNVGGDILDLALERMQYRGRIVVCGAISQYDKETPQGPANYLQIVMQSIKMQGFTMRDYMHRVPEAVQELSVGLKDGSLICRQHILQGLDSFPDGFEMLLAGANEGKLLIRVDHQGA